VLRVYLAPIMQNWTFLQGLNVLYKLAIIVLLIMITKQLNSLRKDVSRLPEKSRFKEYIWKDMYNQKIEPNTGTGGER
jgi:hypothetical protein